MSPITSVLVANRGEIAVRVIRTLRRMGVRSIAVFSDADADAPHVHQADTAVHIGPTPATQSYLDIDRVVRAARDSGAQAVHPGYGFLSENVDFALALQAAGIIFIGPPVQALEAMGDKIRAKHTAIAAGVPVVPGRHDPGMDDHTIIAAAADMGYPVLLKPSAGGGGKGMRIVTDSDQLADSIASARREARGSFGDDTLLIERFVTQPRHIEVQVFADTHGNVVHLGERECSLQRRHQKVIEEAPSPLLDADTRARVCASAVRLAQAVGYVGAGTVEYVVPADAPDDFAFLEMNTRLQVEHPVTEMITGIDLVEWQVRIAAGETLPLSQEEISFTGHAMEARVYAEDPARGFIPTGGQVLDWQPPSFARVDSGIQTGSVISSAYDPMLAKVIVASPHRATTVAKAHEALGHTIVLGVGSNVDYLRFLLEQPQVRAGDLDTGLIERLPVPARPPVAAHLLVAAALAVQPKGAGVGFAAGDSWRISGRAPWSIDAGVVGSDERHALVFHAPDRMVIDELAHEVSCRIVTDGARVIMDVRVDDVLQRVSVAVDGDLVWTHSVESGTAQLRLARPIDRRLRGGSAGELSGSWIARSPMPGTVVDVPVVVGAQINAGDPVVVVEAMKMEHTLRAPATGVVTAVRTSTGSQVRLDEELIEVELTTDPQDQEDST